jgi:hypothetical protein
MGAAAFPQHVYSTATARPQHAIEPRDIGATARQQHVYSTPTSTSAGTDRGPGSRYGLYTASAHRPAFTPHPPTGRPLHRVRPQSSATGGGRALGPAAAEIYIRAATDSEGGEKTQGGAVTRGAVTDPSRDRDRDRLEGAVTDWMADWMAEAAP